MNHQRRPQAKSLFEDFVAGFLGEMAVECAHSLKGLIMTGGLAYLAIQIEKGKGWNQTDEETKDMKFILQRRE